MLRSRDPIRWMLVGLALAAFVLYWFLPRPRAPHPNPRTGQPRTTVTVVGGFVERDRQMWHAIKEGFERDNPDLELKVLRGGGTDRKVDTMIAGGVAPDIIEIEFDKLYYYVNAGALLDLAPFVKADPQLQRDIQGYTDSTGRQPPDFFEFAVNAFRGAHGELYALPTWYLNFFVYYNKTLFDKYNVPYPDEDWDWQGFRDRAIALTRDREGRPLHIPKRDSSGRLVRDNHGWIVYEPNLQADPAPYECGVSFATWQYGPETFIRQNGGRYIVDRGLPDEHVDLSNPRTRTALEFLYDVAITNQCQPRAASAPGSGSTVNFRSGRLGMFLYGVFALIDVRDQVRDIDWDVAPLPKGPDGTRASLVKPFGYGVTRQSKHPEAAFAFVKWFSGRPGAAILSKWPLFVPPRRSIALSEEHFLNPAEKPDSRWAMVHDVSYPYTDPHTGREQIGYAFLPEAASVRHDDVYKAINDGISELFYFRSFTDDQFNAFRAAQHREPSESEARALHRAALDRAIADIHARADRAYRWGRSLRETHAGPVAWPLWLPVAAILLAAAALGGWRFVRRPAPLGPLERRQQYWGYLLTSPWLIGFVGLTAGPILFSIGLSLCNWQSLTSLGDAQYIGIENYRRALTGDDPLFYTALRATLQYTAIAVPLLVVGGLVLALFMNTKLRGINLWRTFYFVPSVLPIVAVVVLYFYLFSPDDGWINHVLRWLGWQNPPQWPVSAEPVLGVPAAMWMFILMSLWAVGGSMIIYLGSLQGIPTQLYEAAEVDGAGWLRQLRHVTLPMISPVLFFMLIMGIIGSFQVFTTAYVLFESEGGPRNCTLFYVLHLFNEAVNRYRFGYAAALAWILFAIILVLTAVVFKSSPMWVYYEGRREKATGKVRASSGGRR
jgi:multiple sugar transport system permease protein